MNPIPTTAAMEARIIDKCSVDAKDDAFGGGAESGVLAVLEIPSVVAGPKKSVVLGRVMGEGAGTVTGVGAGAVAGAGTNVGTGTAVGVRAVAGVPSPGN
jgi:hypothetical protein